MKKTFLFLMTLCATTRYYSSEHLLYCADTINSDNELSQFIVPIVVSDLESSEYIVDKIDELIENIDASSINPTGGDVYNVPSNKGFKSYMDYRTITSPSSYQYKLQNLYAYTSDNGIRMVNDRYCIAVGTHFTSTVGQYLDLILENGTVIPCVLSDVKADIHTDENNIASQNGCVSEFIVDTPVLHDTARKMGDISYCHEEWKSPVVEIIVYDTNVFIY